MRILTADLHIHSALSPCADEEMTPEYIVYAAVAAELDMIAICDHNNAGNVSAVCEAARAIAGDFLHVLPGMEITSREEAHVLGLYPSVSSATAASEELSVHLPMAGPSGNPFGSQPLMDMSGNTVGTVDRLLSFASDLSLSDVAALVRRHEGVVIAAHVDRPSFSVVSQLGFIPEDVAFDALEISAAGCKQGRQSEFCTLGYPLVTASDAHYLQNVGDARLQLRIESPCFDELVLSLRGAGGRTCTFA